MSAKPEATTRRTAAKKAAKKTPRKVPKGYMKKEETVPLAIAARAALDFQIHLGNEEEGTDFKKWRHAQVMKVAGRKGLTDCLHEHYRPLMGHFLTLQGLDEKAIELFFKTGKVKAHGLDGDTFEEREKYAFEIRRRIEEHIHLADTEWTALLPIFDKEGRDDTWVISAMNRKLKIWEADPENPKDQPGPVRQGYVVWLVRCKTRRKDLNLGPDIWKGLAERCSIKQIKEILSTVVNRINAKEGVGDRRFRNRKQRSKSEKARRSVKTLAPRDEKPEDSLFGLNLDRRVD